MYEMKHPQSKSQTLFEESKTASSRQRPTKGLFRSASIEKDFGVYGSVGGVLEVGYRDVLALAVVRGFDRNGLRT